MERPLDRRIARPSPPKARNIPVKPLPCPNTGYSCPAFTGRCELIEASRHAQFAGISIAINRPDFTTDSEYLIPQEAEEYEQITSYIDGVAGATFDAVKALSSAVQNNNFKNSIASCAGTIVTASVPINPEPN